MHDLGNAIWTRPPDSPRGHVSPAEGGHVLDRATTGAVLAGIFAKMIWEAEIGGGRYSSAAPWYAAGVAFVVMLVAGYLHYRNRGEPPDDAE